MRVQNSKTHTIKGFLIGIFFMLGIYAINTYAFTITTDFENAVQYIKRIFVTSNAKPNGTPIVSINTDDKAMIVYGTASFLGNVDIQGTLNATLDELDPIRSAVATNYYTKNEIDANQYTKSEINAKGYLTGETDPIRSAAATNYYTKNEINAKGYITGYTETDPQIGTITTSGKRCTSDGSQINCDEDAPAGSSSVDTYREEGDTSSRIFFNGYIGIGGYSPSERLQIGNWFTLHSNIGHTYISQNFTYTGGDAKRLYEGGSAQIALENDGDIILRTASTGITGSTISYTTGMRINSSGYVGINTSNPMKTLDVVGEARITQTLTVQTLNVVGETYVASKLGIGTFPNGALDVDGTVSIIGINDGGSYLDMVAQNNGGKKWSIVNTWGTTGKGLSFFYSGSNILTMSSEGSLGINGYPSQAPYHKLYVDGSSYLTLGMTMKGVNHNNPCGNNNAPEGTMFYNEIDNYFCYCNGNGYDADKLHDPGTDCW